MICFFLLWNKLIFYFSRGDVLSGIFSLSFTKFQDNLVSPVKIIFKTNRNEVTYIKLFCAFWMVYINYHFNLKVKTIQSIKRRSCFFLPVKKKDKVFLYFLCQKNLLMSYNIIASRIVTSVNIVKLPWIFICFSFRQNLEKDFVPFGILASKFLATKYTLFFYFNIILNLISFFVLQ